MAYRKISISDIAYYAGYVVVYGEPIKQVINGRTKHIRQCEKYKIKKLKAVKVTEHFNGKKKMERFGQEVDLGEIFKKIKLVYDFNGILIARRAAINQPLRITAKGMSKFIKIK